MFPYDEYLKLAKEWANASDEAHLRCAVSRAYYACFNLIKEYAEQNGKIFSKRRAHYDAIEFLKNNSDIKINSLCSLLKRLKKNREKCDYEKKVIEIDRKVRKAIIESDKIFSILLI